MRYLKLIYKAVKLCLECVKLRLLRLTELIAQEINKNTADGGKTVFRLVENERAIRVHDLVRDLLTACGGKAMHE